MTEILIWKRRFTACKEGSSYTGRASPMWFRSTCIRRPELSRAYRLLPVVLLTGACEVCWEPGGLHNHFEYPHFLQYLSLVSVRVAMQMKRTEHAAEIASIGLGPVGCPKIRTIEGSNLCRHGAYGKCASVFTRESVQDVFANHSSVYIALFSTASQNIQRSELVVAPQGVRLQEVTYQDSAASREAPARAVLDLLCIDLGKSSWVAITDGVHRYSISECGISDSESPFAGVANLGARTTTCSRTSIMELAEAKHTHTRCPTSNTTWYTKPASTLRYSRVLLMDLQPRRRAQSWTDGDESRY